MIAPFEAIVARLRRAAPGMLLVASLAASPAGAADFEVANLTLDLGAYKVTAPRLQVKGSPLEREAFVALFDKSASESGSARMARLNADEISADELTIVQTIGTQTDSTTYRAVRFGEIRDGKIGRGETAGGSLTSTGPVSAEYKPIRAEALDLRQVIRVHAERAAPGAVEQALPLYRLMTYEGGTLTFEGPVTLSYGKASDRDLKGRAGPASFADIMTTVSRANDLLDKTAGAPDRDVDELKEAEQQLRVAMSALLDMYELDSGEVNDLSLKSQVPLTTELRVARIAYGGAAVAQTGLSLEGLDLGMGSGASRHAPLKIGSLSLSGFSFTGTVKEIKDALAKPDTGFEEALSDWRRFMPKLGRLRIADLSAEIPLQPSLSIGSLDLNVADQREGLPTDLTLAIETIKLPLNEPVLLPFGNMFTGLGYQELNLSARLDLAWQEATSEIALRSLSLDGAGIGKLSASGTLGNVAKDVFSSDTAMMQIAALGATARALDVRLENAGLAERLLAEQARQTKRKPTDIQREYGAQAKTMLSGLLGKSADARALIDVAGRFVANPRVMTVQARAKASGGLGLADVIAVTAPAQVFDKIEVKANAE